MDSPKYRFGDLINLARKHGACSYHLKQVEACASLEEAKKHYDAPYWCWWVCANVLGEEERLSDASKLSFGYLRLLRNKLHVSIEYATAHPEEDLAVWEAERSVLEYRISMAEKRAYIADYTEAVKIILSMLEE